MGQAKRRGKYEQRKKEAMDKKARAHQEMLMIRQRRQSPKHSGAMARMMAVALGVGVVGIKDR